MSACPHPDCVEPIGASMFACRRHWHSLPEWLQAEIWANYRSGDVDRILAGYSEARAFWRGTP